MPSRAHLEIFELTACEEIICNNSLIPPHLHYMCFSLTLTLLVGVLNLIQNLFWAPDLKDNCLLFSCFSEIGEDAQEWVRAAGSPCAPLSACPVGVEQMLEAG